MSSLLSKDNDFLQELDIKLKRKTKKLNKNSQQTLFIFSVEKLCWWGTIFTVLKLSHFCLCFLIIYYCKEYVVLSLLINISGHLSPLKTGNDDNLQNHS